jgi:hypothetical protein
MANLDGRSSSRDLVHSLKITSLHSAYLCGPFRGEQKGSTERRHEV